LCWLALCWPALCLSGFVSDRGHVDRRPPTGTVRVSLVSLNGPLQPRGPIAATTLDALDAELAQRAQAAPPRDLPGGEVLADGEKGDWRTSLPFLLARPHRRRRVPTAVSADGVRTGDTTLRIDIHAVDRCHQTNGSGALARATPDVVRSRWPTLPPHTRVTVAVRFHHRCRALRTRRWATPSAYFRDSVSDPKHRTTFTAQSGATPA